MCTRKFGGTLYEGTKQVCSQHLKAIGERLDKSSENFLRLALKQWLELKKNASMVKDLLFYMDENYSIKEKKIPVIYNVIVVAFREQILANYQSKIQRLMMEVIEKERNGEGVGDRSLIIGLTQMLLELDKTVDDKERKAYTGIFENEFLKQSRNYFAKEAQTFFDSATATQYLERVRNRLREEQERTSACSDGGTPAKIQKVILEEFVEKYKEALVKKQGSGVLVMLQNNNLEDLKLVYEVLSLVEGALDPSIDMLKEFALKEAKSIIDDPEKDKEPSILVEDIIVLRSKYEKMLNFSFSKPVKVGESKTFQDPKFAKALKDTFEEAINSHPRFSEYLSLLLDKKVRKGKDQLKEEEADDYLTKALMVVRHIKDKDFFMEYYKNHLSKRLYTQATSPDDENEKLIITKLKQEYGYALSGIAKCEGMLKDLKTSEGLKEEWKRYQTNRVESKKMEKLLFDLNVQVLTFGHWPSVSNSSLILPTYVSQGVKEFETFFKSKFEGRRLMWMYTLGTADLRSNGFGTKYEMNVTSYMMGILLAFNDQDKITFEELLEVTKIPADSLKSSLIQLCAPTSTDKDPSALTASKVINHNAKKDEKTQKTSFTKETQFVPNEKFKNKIAKIKIGAAVKKESQESLLETKKRVEDSRQIACQGTIVRIMKMRKALDHKVLVNEIRQQLSQLFQPELRLITEAISALIDQEYLKRDEDTPTRYIYLP